MFRDPYARGSRDPMENLALRKLRRFVVPPPRYQPNGITRCEPIAYPASICQDASSWLQFDALVEKWKYTSDSGNNRYTKISL